MTSPPIANTTTASTNARDQGLPADRARTREISELPTTTPHRDRTRAAGVANKTNGSVDPNAAPAAAPSRQARSRRRREQDERQRRYERHAGGGADLPEAFSGVGSVERAFGDRSGDRLGIPVRERQSHGRPPERADQDRL